MAATLTWYLGNRMHLAWTAEGANLDGSANDGSGLTVTATLLDRVGEEVWTGALEEMSTTDGKTLYAVTADAGVPILADRPYRLEVMAMQGEVQVYTGEELVTAAVRSDAV